MLTVRHVGRQVDIDRQADIDRHGGRQIQTDLQVGRYRQICR